MLALSAAFAILVPAGYQIATELFGRPSDFDPRLDSTVRVQTGRLRSKLAEYYAGPGDRDPKGLGVIESSTLRARAALGHAAAVSSSGWSVARPGRIAARARARPRREFFRRAGRARSVAEQSHERRPAGDRAIISFAWRMDEFRRLGAERSAARGKARRFCPDAALSSRARGSRGPRRNDARICHHAHSHRTDFTASMELSVESRHRPGVLWPTAKLR